MVREDPSDGELGSAQELFVQTDSVGVGTTCSTSSGACTTAIRERAEQI